MSRRLLWAALLFGSILSLAASYGVAMRELEIGSSAGGWSYSYIDQFSSRAIEAVLIASVFTAAFASASWSWIRRSPQPARGLASADRALILGWVVFAVALDGFLRSLTPFTLARIFADDLANSFYSVAMHNTTTAILRHFERARLSWPVHAQSNLPGKLLLVRVLTQVSTDPGTLAWLVLLISNLGALPLFAVVRDLFNDRRVAWLAAVLYLLTPAKLLFFPLLNTVTPVVVFLCAWLLVRWLRTGRAGYAALLGVGVYGLVLYEPTALAVGLIFAVLIARALARREITTGAVVVGVGAGLVGFLAIYGAMSWRFGFDLVAALRAVADDAKKFNVTAARPYALWVRANLIEFAFGVGLAQFVLFWAALGLGLSKAGAGRRRLGDPIVVLCLSLVATLAAIDLIGVNRGEVIRLWIFLACLFQIPAAYACAELDSRTAIALVLITTILQVALGTSMAGFIVPG